MPELAIRDGWRSSNNPIRRVPDASRANFIERRCPASLAPTIATFFASLPFFISVFMALSETSRALQRAIPLVKIQVASQRREKLSETLKTKKQPVNRSTTSSRRLIVDLSAPNRLGALEVP